MVVARTVIRVIDGRIKTSRGLLKQIGDRGAELVRKQFDTMNGWAAPLADWTKQAKGHNTIGYDTFVMADAIGSEVRKK